MSYSVIVPVFNEYQYLSQLIKNLEQLPNDIEIIIIDDGSTDGSYVRY